MLATVLGASILAVISELKNKCSLVTHSYNTQSSLHGAEKQSAITKRVQSNITKTIKRVDFLTTQTLLTKLSWEVSEGEGDLMCHCDEKLKGFF